jgi:hypothetical protein
LNRKVLLVGVLLSTLLFTGVAGTQVVDLAEANPMWDWRFDASPIITVQSPENNKTYASDNVFLVFNLTKPTEDLGGYPYSNNWYEPIENSNDGGDFGNRVVNATFYVDGQSSNVSIEVDSHLLEPFHYSLPLEGLAEGNHSLQICLFNYGVEGVMWTTAGNLHYCNYYSYSEIVNFTVVDADSILLKARPLSVSMMTDIIAVLVAIVCIEGGLLFYFNKRK